MTVATNGAEAALTAEVLAALDPYFTFKQQHPGTHFNGSRYRIDAIAIPRDREHWARKDIALGIEFKAPTNRPEDRRDRKANARIISQCIDYSFTAWDGFGQIPIFFCPGFAETKSLRERREDWLFDAKDYQLGFKHGIGYLMEAMLGQNNIGELIYTSHTGWNFLMNGDCRIWSERLGRYPGGVGVGKHHKLQRRSGSR